MFSTIFQLSFIIENITFNYKMFFTTQKWRCQLISKIGNNVESILQHNWKQCTHVNLWVNVEVTTFRLKTIYILVDANFNYKLLTRPNWLHDGKSIDELHPPTCHVIWGRGIGIMTFFQLYYNQCSIGMCHVIEEGHEILEFWLSFSYIITRGTFPCVTWAFVVHHQTKLFDMCHVYGFKILNLLICWKCQHMILCHVGTYVTHLHDTWHFVVCRSLNICEIEPK
jgi:hypothetical protein